MPKRKSPEQRYFNNKLQREASVEAKVFGAGLGAAAGIFLGEKFSVEMLRTAIPPEASALTLERTDLNRGHAIKAIPVGTYSIARADAPVNRPDAGVFFVQDSNKLPFTAKSATLFKSPLGDSWKIDGSASGIGNVVSVSGLRIGNELDALLVGLSRTGSLKQRVQNADGSWGQSTKYNDRLPSMPSNQGITKANIDISEGIFLFDQNLVLEKDGLKDLKISAIGNRGINNISLNVVKGEMPAGGAVDLGLKYQDGKFSDDSRITLLPSAFPEGWEIRIGASELVSRLSKSPSFDKAQLTSIQKMIDDSRTNIVSRNVESQAVQSRIGFIENQLIPQTTLIEGVIVLAAVTVLAVRKMIEAETKRQTRRLNELKQEFVKTRKATEQHDAEVRDREDRMVIHKRTYGWPK